MKKLSLLFLLLFVSFSAHAQSLGFICGTVTDLNGNPLVGYTVHIYADTILNPNNSYYSTQITNSSGQYCDTVPFQPNTTYAYDVAVSDCQNAWQVQNVNLNSAPSSVNFQICSNNMPGNATICGTVKDLNGNPIAGHVVYISGNVSVNPQNTYTSTQVTDANGFYCDTVYFNTSTHYQFDVFVYDCNQVQQLQALNMNSVTGAHFQICDTILNCQICGRLSASNSLVNVDSSWLYLISYDPNTQSLIAVDSTIAYSSNPNSNNFCFYNVAPGTYRVKAAMDPANPAYATHLPTYQGNTLLWNFADTISVCPSVNNLSIVFISGANPGGPGFIGGLVSQGANKTQNTALVGATVILKDNSGNVIAWTKTDVNGAYSFASLAYGTYHISVDVLNLYGSEKIVTISAAAPSSTGNDMELNLNPVSIDAGFNIETASLSLYPNPAKAEVQIALTAAQNSELAWSVYSVSGQEVMTGSYEVAQGNNLLTLDCHSFENGLYFVRLTEKNGAAFTLKMSIAK